MASGTPVACSDAGALPEVAGDAALRFHPGSEDEIADALERLAGDGALRNRLSRAGLQRARRFTWERTAEATFEVLRAAAGRGARTEAA
jgi:glycosyltransferase involved in cell wall biosynthesis